MRRCNVYAYQEDVEPHNEVSFIFGLCPVCCERKIRRNLEKRLDDFVEALQEISGQSRTKFFRALEKIQDYRLTGNTKLKS